MRVTVLLLLVLLAAAIPAKAAETAAPTAIAAIVGRVKGDATAMGSGSPHALAPGDGVQAGWRVRTGDGGRLELAFTDGTAITLGQNADLTIDDFTYLPAAGRGNARFAIAQGAFLVVTGSVGKLPDRPFHVVTPLASIGIRGTTFWGGRLYDPLNVLVLDGAITVENPAGRVEMTTARLGTAIHAVGSAPTPPKAWPEDDIADAMAMVSF